MSNHGNMPNLPQPPNEGSTLPRTLHRFEKTWLDATFRKHVGQEWDQPASMSSAAREPRHLSELLPCLAEWDHLYATDIADTGGGMAGRYPGMRMARERGTAVQLAAVMARRAWPMGDRAALELLRKLLIVTEKLVLAAPWASVRAVVAVDGLDALGPDALDAPAGSEIGPLEKVY